MASHSHTHRASFYRFRKRSFPLFVASYSHNCFHTNAMHDSTSESEVQLQGERFSHRDLNKEATTKRSLFFFSSELLVGLFFVLTNSFSVLMSFCSVPLFSSSARTQCTHMTSCEAVWLNSKCVMSNITFQIRFKANMPVKFDVYEAN